MKRLIGFVQGISAGRNVLLFFIPASVVYFVMVLYTIPEVTQHAPGMKLFDLLPAGYSLAYALDLLSTLGEEGRSLYLHRQLPLDFIYPALFAVSCCFGLAWLLAKVFSKDSKLFYFCLVPLAAGLFDYLENICVASMLVLYPDISQQLVFVASAMTILKSVLTTAFFVVLITVTIIYLRHKRKT